MSATETYRGMQDREGDATAFFFVQQKINPLQRYEPFCEIPKFEGFFSPKKQNLVIRHKTDKRKSEQSNFLYICKG